MKTKILISLFALSICSCSDLDNDLIANISETNNSVNTFRNSSVSIDGGLDAWSRNGNCVRGSGNCAYAIVEEHDFSTDTFPVTFKITGEDEITLEYKFAKEGEDNDNILTFNRDISIPTTICAGLGVFSIDILAGNYPIDYSTNTNGRVILSAIIN